mmetsp:Transcript_35905/g.83245  ORF Transcript_35905/g.83245 Transcript_35905/m.83245 type:complete len:112 (-) Transcript_35905:350-685(-)
MYGGGRGAERGPAVRRRFGGEFPNEAASATAMAASSSVFGRGNAAVGGTVGGTVGTVGGIRGKSGCGGDIGAAGIGGAIATDLATPAGVVAIGGGGIGSGGAWLWVARCSL